MSQRNDKNVKGTVLLTHGFSDGRGPSFFFVRFKGQVLCYDDPANRKGGDADGKETERQAQDPVREGYFRAGTQRRAVGDDARASGTADRARLHGGAQERRGRHPAPADLRAAHCLHPPRQSDGVRAEKNGLNR